MRPPFTGAHTTFRTQIAHKTYSFAEVGEEMYRRLQTIDDESKDSEDPKDRTKLHPEVHEEALFGDCQGVGNPGENHERPDY